MRNTENKNIKAGVRSHKSANPLLKVDVTEERKIADIEFHPHHKYFTGEAVTIDFDALVKSIQQHGFLEPITIEKRSGFAIDGFHRVEAAKKAGIKVVPTRLTKTELSDEEIFIVMYESLRRKYLTKKQQVSLWVAPYGGEEAFREKYKRDKGPAPKGSGLITNEDIAGRFGLKPNTVSKYLIQVLFTAEPEASVETNADANSASTERLHARDMASGPKSRSDISAKATAQPTRKSLKADIGHSNPEHIKQMLRSAFRIFADVLDHSPEQYGRLIELQLKRLLKMVNAKEVNANSGGAP